jgi:XTP/dITP diphosphohydrolase
VLATRNRHKIVEMQRILAEAGLGAALGARPAADPEPAAGVVVLGLDDLPDLPDVAETGTTFAANALLKAHAVAEATGLPAVADDSGLCVDVLGGAPGVFSARWSGRHGGDRANLELLLAQLADVPDEHRGAHFRCAAALATPDRREWVEEGRMVGHLIRVPRGHNGFGYDPIFVPDGEARTSAELSDVEKDAISHRGKALRNLMPHVRGLFEPEGVPAPKRSAAVETERPA